jgi:hypothetical protein
LNFIFGIVCLFVCVCAFSLRRESPDMILGDKTPHFWGGSVTHNDTHYRGRVTLTTWAFLPFFSFHATALALSRPMEWITSSSIAGSLDERNISVVDEPVDLALHLSLCLTASNQCRRLNSYPIQFLYRCFAVSRIMDMEDSDIGEDMMVEVVVVEK